MTAIDDPNPSAVSESDFLTAPSVAADAAFNGSTNPYRWVVLAALWLLYFCFGVIVASLAPLLLPITRDLDISHSAMGSVLGAWPLVYVAAAIPCGAILDRVGPRRALFIAMLILSLSVLLRGSAQSYIALFLAVAVFGLGGRMISVGAPKLVSLWFQGAERGLAMGIYITGPALGAAASLSFANSVLMPALDNNWRGVLMVYSAMALCAGLVWLLVSLHPASRAMEAEIAAEPKASQREVFFNLLRLPAVLVILAMSVCMFFFSHSLNNWLAEILRSGGMSPTRAGFWASMPMVIGIASSLIIPRLATPPRRMAILAALIVCAGAATLLLQAGDGPLLVVALICQGIVRGPMVTVSVLLLMELKGVGSRHTGAASGLFFSAAEMGGVLGPLSIGVLHDATGGFSVGLYVLTAMCALQLGLLGLLRRFNR